MRRAPFLIALLAAVLAGCGDDSSESGGSVTVEAGRPVEVAAGEYSFRPATIVVRAAGGARADVVFRLKNDGSLPHDIRVRAGDDEPGGTEPIGGGETVEATVPLAPGDYEVFCSIGDHEKLGMKGQLTVE